MAYIQHVFASNLKRIRRERGLTQQRLAELADTANGYIAMLENEVKFPSAEMIERLAKALEVNSPALFVPTLESHNLPWHWTS